ncbi:MAG: hypothetical protein Q7S86_01565, partial [bacterium]|nr:hypothetical protein [bacterium]
GGSLKDNTIIRHIEPISFVAWQRLFEDHEMWESVGFDYVPIEPIQSFKFNKEGVVDVFSGVLDLSLETWQNMTDDFVADLHTDQEKIIEVLDKNNIDHGHPSTANFCLRFFRDEEGNVDFKTKPRLYLIDFDMAISLNK